MTLRQKMAFQFNIKYPLWWTKAMDELHLLQMHKVDSEQQVFGQQTASFSKSDFLAAETMITNASSHGNDSQNPGTSTTNFANQPSTVKISSS